MSIITRENIRLPLHILHPVPSAASANGGYSGDTRRIETGDLEWDPEARRLTFVDPEMGTPIIRLSTDNDTLKGNKIRIQHGPPDTRIEPLMPGVDQWWTALAIQGVITGKPHSLRKNGTSCIVELSPDLGAAAQKTSAEKVGVLAVNGHGVKEETWTIPVNATRACDMFLSPDFHLGGRYCMAVGEHPAWNAEDKRRLFFFTDRIPA